MARFTLKRLGQSYDKVWNNPRVKLRLKKTKAWTTILIDVQPHKYVITTSDVLKLSIIISCNKDSKFFLVKHNPNPLHGLLQFLPLTVFVLVLMLLLPFSNFKVYRCSPHWWPPSFCHAATSRVFATLPHFSGHIAWFAANCLRPRQIPRNTAPATGAQAPGPGNQAALAATENAMNNFNTLLSSSQM